MPNTFPRSQDTIPNFFILESLAMEDEEANRFEGKFLYNYLNILGKNPRYIYFRERRELLQAANIFRKSGYRYLYLSCHGNEKSIYTTFDEIAFDDFAAIFHKKLDHRRLFLSGCSLGQSSLAEALFQENGGMFSITAPKDDVCFTQTLPFWSSFIYLVESIDSRYMKGATLFPSLHLCSDIFNINTVHFYKKYGKIKKTEHMSEGIFSDEVLNKMLNLKKHVSALSKIEDE